MVKNHTGKWCFAAWRIDKATSDSVNASEVGENFAYSTRMTYLRSLAYKAKNTKKTKE